MLRLVCRKCGRSATAGKLIAKDGEQYFTCWKCLGREEQEKEVREKNCAERQSSDEEELRKLIQEQRKYNEQLLKMIDWNKNPYFPDLTRGLCDFPVNPCDNKEYRTYPTTGK